MEIIDYDIFKAYMTRIQSVSNYTLINEIHNSLLYQRDIISDFISENSDDIKINASNTAITLF